MMVLDVEINKVITEKIAGKVFSNFFRFLLHLALDLYILFNLRHLEAFFGHGEENKKCLELNFIPENGPGCED